MNETKVSHEFVLLMAALMSVVAISIDAMLPALGVIGKALNASHENQPQLIILFIFIGMAVGQLVAGPLSDAMGRKRLLFITLGIYLVGTFICLLAGSMETMLAGRLIQGIGVAGPYVSTVSVVRDQYAGRAMAKVMSLVMMIFIAIPIVAPALGQAILSLHSWQAIFVLFIVYAVGIGVWIAVRLPESLPLEKRTPFRFQTLLQGARTVLGNRQTVSYMIATGLIFGAFIGFLGASQQVYQVQYEKGEAFVIYFAVQAFGFGLASLTNSRIVERLGMRYVCVRACITIMVSAAIMWGISLYTPIPFWLFYAHGLIILFCFGMMFGNLNALALEPMGHIAGTAAAIVGATGSILSIMLATIIGQSYDGTLTPIMTGYTLLSASALFIMLFVAPKKTFGEAQSV